MQNILEQTFEIKNIGYILKNICMHTIHISIADYMHSNISEKISLILFLKNKI